MLIIAESFPFVKQWEALDQLVEVPFPDAIEGHNRIPVGWVVACKRQAQHHIQMGVGQMTDGKDGPFVFGVL